MVVHARYPIGETRVVREASALIDLGIEVHVVCLREPGESAEELVDGVRVHRLAVRRRRDLGMAFQLLEYLAFLILATMRVARLHVSHRSTGGFATVQAHNLPDFLVFSAIVPKLDGAAVILDLHDLMPEFYEARTGRAGWGLRIVQLQERLSCRFADHVITVSEGWRQDLAERGSVPLSRSSVVMNVPDPRAFPPGSAEPLAFDVEGESFRVVYHGTFTHRYGVDLIVEAADLLVDRIPGLQVDLLGDGEQRSELEALIDQRDLGSVVRLSDGMLDVAEMQPLLRRAHVGVVPNRSNVFTNGILPTKLMEYLALGLPTVVSRTLAVERTFDDTMVHFVKPGDAMAIADGVEHLYRDSERARSLTDGARVFTEMYNWSTEAGRYATLVRELGGHTSSKSDGYRSDRASPGLSWSASDATQHDLEWDMFASAHGAHHSQSSRWNSAAEDSREALRLVVRRDGAIVGGVVIRVRSISLPILNLRLGSVGYVFGGPVAEGIDTRLQVVAAMQEMARARRMALFVEAERIEDVIVGPGWRQTGIRGSLGATVLVDLTPDLDVILASMKPQTRANIRKGTKRGVVVERAEPSETSVLIDLLHATGERQGFDAESGLTDLVEKLDPAGQAAIFLAKVDDEPVSGALLILFGDTVVYKRGAWSGSHGDKRPNEAMHWAMIEWAKEAGYRWYDFDGLERAAADAAIADQPLPAKYQQSVSRFKIGFATKILVRPDATLYIPNRVMAGLVTRFEPLLADRGRLKRLQRWARRR